METSHTAQSGDATAADHLVLRPCRDDERKAILSIINAAAQVYRGKIPPELWHEPYMSADELSAEIAAGVVFTASEHEGALAGVMGIQRVRNVDLIRHAYVLPAAQGRGLGSALIRDLQSRTTRQILVGTWAAARWAIGFYERHGFRLVPDQARASLLRAYWTVSEHQIGASVVLAAPNLTETLASELIRSAGETGSR